MKLLKLFSLNLLARIIDIIIFSIVIFIYYKLPVYKVNFLFDEVNLFANLGFLLLFIIYGIISLLFLNNRTVGEFIFKIGNDKISNVKYKNKFFLMIELCFLNIFEIFKRALFLNILIYFINRSIEKKELKKNNNQKITKK